MSNSSRSIVFPVTLIVVGILFLGYNLGYIGFAQLRQIIGTWWPVVLIAVGIAGLVNRGK